MQRTHPSPVAAVARRRRRSSEQVRAEILAAAGHLLLTEGMGGFTIEGVAERASASKMTIYKWWSSKGVLALEGYASTIDAALAVPDTGDIEADLTQHLLFYVHLLRETPAGRVVAELLGEAQTDPQLAVAFRRTYAAPRRAVGLAALRAAQDRGQIRPDADPDFLIDQIWGACLYRLLVGDQPLTDAFARNLVTNLFTGLGRADRSASAPAPPAARGRPAATAAPVPSTKSSKRRVP